ncbi:MAG: glycosyltransferase [Anaerolineae bacterium]
MRRDAFFRRIDVLALCSRTENLPYTILEAMAWSRPVVAARVGGVPDLVEPDKTGLLVEPGDVEAMARAIARLVGDPAWAQSLGAAGRGRLEGRFTLERSVEAHLEMYCQLANEH